MLNPGLALQVRVKSLKRQGPLMLVEVINGLLGAGKTTYLLNKLNDKTPAEKIAVLVNEFGEIGIDGDLLSGRGADVVELPNGCICCTLNADLRNQIRVIAETYHPDRLYIEPTGVATIKNLLGILGSLGLEKYIDDIKIHVILDAGSFWEIFGQNRGFVETQIQLADIVIVNKCDLAKDEEEIKKIAETVRNINPSANIRLTSFGRVIRDGQALEEATGSRSTVPLDTVSRQPDTALKKFQQFSTSSKESFNLESLRNLFAALKANRFGEIDRAKGIFRAGDKWVRFDLASHVINEQVSENSFESSKIIVIGTGLNKDALKNEFKKCFNK